MDDIKPLRAVPLREANEPPPLPIVEGGWKTILADPPWRFTNRTGKVAPEHRRLDRYSTLDVDAICDIPVSQVAARDAHLYLWVPNALLPDGIRVMQAWGYRYVSNVIWAKRRKDGGPDGRGVGFYFRNVTEIILFGVRGSMRTLPHARSQVNMIETRKREHSRKPDEQYAFIEACSPGPYLELFSRHPQPGWSGWGDEAGEDVVPRGRVHKGYGGGAIEVPAVTKHVRLDPATRERVGKEMRILYESGKSIREIVDETGYSITRVRRLLQNAGTTFRTQGSH
ncbi:MT-A70 family methyltransferase [Mycobacterium sp. LTG2003]